MNFPAEGEYAFRFKGWGTKAGDDFPKVAVRVAGADVKTFTVDAEPAKAKVYEAVVKVTAGEKKVAVAFTNGFEDKANKKFREFGLEFLEVEGPFNPVPLPEPASVKLCSPPAPGPAPTPAPPREGADELRPPRVPPPGQVRRGGAADEAVRPRGQAGRGVSPARSSCR
jgi:hypothetical protein